MFNFVTNFFPPAVGNRLSEATAVYRLDRLFSISEPYHSDRRKRPGLSTSILPGAQVVMAGISDAVNPGLAQANTDVTLGSATVVVALKITTGGTPYGKYVVSTAVQDPQSTDLVRVVVVVQTVRVGPQVHWGWTRTVFVQPSPF